MTLLDVAHTIMPLIMTAVRELMNMEMNTSSTQKLLSVKLKIYHLAHVKDAVNSTAVMN